VAAVLRGHQDWVYGVAASADGSLVASGGADGTVNLWNGTARKQIATLIQLKPGADQWAILTQQGHFATSAPAKIGWQSDGTAVPADQRKTLVERYHAPEKVRAALGGGK
jgi:WD40 repeat protein